MNAACLLSAAAPLSLIQSCLGLSFDPARLEVSFDRPLLPDFLNEITLRGLKIGNASVDVALTRSGSGVVVETLARRGDIRVLTRN